MQLFSLSVCENKLVSLHYDGRIRVWDNNQLQFQCVESVRLPIHAINTRSGIFPKTLTGGNSFENEFSKILCVDKWLISLDVHGVVRIVDINDRFTFYIPAGPFAVESMKYFKGKLILGYANGSIVVSTLDFTKAQAKNPSSGSNDEEVAVWTIGKDEGDVQFGHDYLAIAGDRLFAGQYSDGEIWVFDLNTLERLHKLDTGDAVFVEGEVEFRHVDGKMIAIGNDNDADDMGRVLIWDIHAGKGHTLKTFSGIACHAYGDGKLFLIYNMEGKRLVEAYDVDTGKRSYFMMPLQVSEAVYKHFTYANGVLVATEIESFNPVDLHNSNTQMESYVNEYGMTVFVAAPLMPRSDNDTCSLITIRAWNFDHTEPLALMRNKSAISCVSYFIETLGNVLQSNEKPLDWETRDQVLSTMRQSLGDHDMDRLYDLIWGVYHPTLVTTIEEEADQEAVAAGLDGGSLGISQDLTPPKNPEGSSQLTPADRRSWAKKTLVHSLKKKAYANGGPLGQPIDPSDAPLLRNLLQALIQFKSELETERNDH